jgi:hypothetical protein
MTSSNSNKLKPFLSLPLLSVEGFLGDRVERNEAFDT